MATDALTSGPETAPVRLDGAAVLVVDDNPPIRGILAAALERAGADASTAADAASAVQAAQARAASSRSFDAVVLDHLMPGRRDLDGRGAAGRRVPGGRDRVLGGRRRPGGRRLEGGRLRRGAPQGRAAGFPRTAGSALQVAAGSGPSHQRERLCPAGRGRGA